MLKNGPGYNLPFVIDNITVEDLLQGEEQDGFRPEDDRERERMSEREKREEREGGSTSSNRAENR